MVIMLIKITCDKLLWYLDTDGTKPSVSMIPGVKSYKAYSKRQEFTQISRN